jgi:hypothetical protein
MAASTVWVKGEAYGAVAKHLKQIVLPRKVREARLQDLDQHFAAMWQTASSFANVSFITMDNASSLAKSVQHLI